jgi:hypothetical protein
VFLRSYDSLEYPLIFLHGEDGYAIDILSFNVNLNEYNSHKTVSSKQFYAYRMMVRHHIYNHLHNYRKLINKYWVSKQYFFNLIKNMYKYYNNTKIM